ncbi:MAG: GTP-binding protein, partial [Myxococcota bacterium]
MDGSAKDLARVVTAGSVDDGKSTLLGRILADTGSVPEDQLERAQRESARRGHDGLDPSLLLDGLEDERAQGITIDVAYRYFSTARRAFVLADAPGHVRYTRNMATGAAGCDVALLLVDAEKGVGPQTRRHAFVAALMGVRHLVVAVNKMDRVDWRQDVFESVRESFAKLVARLDVSDVSFVPVSALLGVNVVHPSPELSWFHGPSLLERLETMYVASDRNLVDLRFPVQMVLTGSEISRTLVGTLVSGVLRTGDRVRVMPSGEEAEVTSLCVGGDRKVLEAEAGEAISCTLDRDIDVARGDVLCPPRNRPRVSRKIDCTLVWMDETPLALERSYRLKLGTRWISARVERVEYRLDTETGHRAPVGQVGLNDIARLRLSLDEPIVHDEFRRVRALGSFILVDRDTSVTAAAGVVIDRGQLEDSSGRGSIVWLGLDPQAPARAERIARSADPKERVVGG